MRTIKAAHWTADWQLARVLQEGYGEAGFEKIAILCLGDPKQPGDFVAHFVADELSRYHPMVFGTSRAPIHGENLSQALERHGEHWENRFLAVVAAGRGQDDFGAIRADLGGELAVPGPDGSGEDLVLYPDAQVFGITRHPSRSAREVLAERGLRRQVERCGNAIIDGFLRFMHKIGYDHTVGERP